MKKFLKSLSVICLALVILCPLALVGCDRKYTIDIEVVQGQEGGLVCLKDVPGISVARENVVAEGEKFEYYVVPSPGYKIAKILIDGKAKEIADPTTGIYLSFDEVKKNHKVKVYFAEADCTISFMCVAAGGGFELFKTVSAAKNSSIDLNQSTYGGAKALWYYKDGSQNIYFFNGLTTVTDTVPEGYEDSNILFVRGNAEVYCNKTAAELIDMGVVK